MDQDQLDELEAISAIFVDEHESLDASQTQAVIVEMGWADRDVRHVIKLNLLPQPDDKGQVHVGASLLCGMPATYPAEAPLLVTCRKTKGLSDNHLDEVIAEAQKVADESVGMPSVFVTADAVKEWLERNNLAGLDGSMYSDMMRRIQNKEVEKKLENERAAIKKAADSEKRVGEPQIDEAELERIRKRQAGTMVTVETFVVWKKAFDEEMERKRALLGADIKVSEKPSGKQWFLAQQAAGVPSAWLAEEDELLAKLSAEVAAEVEAQGDQEGEEDDDDEDEDYEDEDGVEDQDDYDDEDC